MNPFLALRISALNPFHRTASLFFLHTNVTMVIRFNLITTLTTKKLIVHNQILTIFQFMRAHLTLETKLTNILIIHF